MIEEREGSARENLLREMRAICLLLTRQPWTDDLVYQLYDLMIGETENFDGRPLATALQPRIDALTELSDAAGGWFADNDPAAFLPFADWEPRYEAWKLKW